MWLINIIINLNSSLTQDFRSLGTMSGTSLVVEISLETLWPDACVSVSNSLKAASLKYFFDEIFLEQENYLVLKHINVLLLTNKIENANIVLCSWLVQWEFSLLDLV